MISWKNFSRIDVNRDTITSALEKKIDNYSLSQNTLSRLVEITNSTSTLSKYEAEDIFLYDTRLPPTARSAKVADQLKNILPKAANPALKQQIEKFIFNCNAIPSDKNTAAAPLTQKAASYNSTYADAVSETDYSSDESTAYEGDSTYFSLSESKQDDCEDPIPEKEPSGPISCGKKKAEENNKTPVSQKRYSGYEKNIFNTLQNIVPMETSELVKLIKKRDEIHIQMREKDVQARHAHYCNEKLNAESGALAKQLDEYNPVIRNQELFYEATHGTGIHFKQDHIPPRRGEHCKLVSLSLLDAYFSERMGKYHVPLLKEHYFNVSLRQMAKEEGSLQGEILESTMLKKIAERIGYTVEMVRPQNLTEFKDCLKNNVNDKGIIIFYVIETEDLHDIYDDRFFPSYEKLETYEHASVISWYDSEREICTLNHWQEKYPGIPVELLYKSNQSLLKTRMRELYSLSEPEKHLNRDYDDPKYGKRLYKYRVEHYRQHWSGKDKKYIDSLQTITPAPGTGFKGLVMLIEPDKNHCRWDPQQQYVLRKRNTNPMEWVAKP